MAHIEDIRQQAVINDNFRHVLETGGHTQVVLMSIPPGEETGREVHQDNDQVLYLVEGRGRSVMSGRETDFEAGDIVLVPAGIEHNFIADSGSPLNIITTYSPPLHPNGLIHRTKAEADAYEAAS